LPAYFLSVPDLKTVILRVFKIFLQEICGKGEENLRNVDFSHDILIFASLIWFKKYIYSRRKCMWSSLTTVAECVNYGFLSKGM
jgi:hypothetical protein